MACDPRARVLGALGTPDGASGRRAAMAGEEPVGDVIDDVEAFAAEAAQAGKDLVGEVAEAAGEVAADVALEVAPLAFLAVEFGAVAGEPDDVQPGSPLGQRRLTGLAAMAGTVIQDEEDLPARGR